MYSATVKMPVKMADDIKKIAKERGLSLAGYIKCLISEDLKKRGML